MKMVSPAFWKELWETYSEMAKHPRHLLLASAIFYSGLTFGGTAYGTGRIVFSADRPAAANRLIADYEKDMGYRIVCWPAYLVAKRIAQSGSEGSLESKVK
jgi:hypothetical protein